MRMDSFLKSFIWIKKSLQSDLQLRFLKLIHRLLTNGYSIVEALDTIKWNKEMTKPAEVIMSSLKDGFPIDEAFDNAGFHHSITSYLYFVRSNGDLEGSIEKCVNMYDYRIKYTKKFQQTARYPLLLFFILGLLLYFIRKSVLPSFQDLFHSNGDSSAVMITIQIIELFSSIITVLAVFLIGTISIWILTKHRLSIEKKMKIYSKIPVYRNYLKLQTSFHFAAHFSSLLKTGMSFKEILHHMSKQQKLPIISYYAYQMTNELSKGLHIASLLTVFTFLEKQLTGIFRKNADAEALENDLRIYAELLIEEIQRKMVKSITLIQPVFFLILASFIIFIYIALMWPMFQLIKTI